MDSWIIDELNLKLACGESNSNLWEFWRTCEIVQSNKCLSRIQSSCVEFWQGSAACFFLVTFSIFKA